MTIPPKSLAATLAECTAAHARSIHSGNTEWRAIYAARLASLRDLLPSGSGVDSGTRNVSVTDARITMEVDYHHMTEGMYDGWTHHKVTVRPAWDDITITVSGPNRNDIRDYLGELYYHVLSMLVTWDETLGRYVAVES